MYENGAFPGPLHPTSEAGGGSIVNVEIMKLFDGIHLYRSLTQAMREEITACMQGLEGKNNYLILEALTQYLEGFTYKVDKDRYMTILMNNPNIFSKNNGLWEQFITGIVPTHFNPRYLPNYLLVGKDDTNYDLYKHVENEIIEIIINYELNAFHDTWGEEDLKYSLFHLLTIKCKVLIKMFDNQISDGKTQELKELIKNDIQSYSSEINDNQIISVINNVLGGIRKVDGIVKERLETYKVMAKELFTTDY